MTNEFLPSDYSVPASGGNYLTLSKLPEGDKNIRILSSAVIGYEYWTTENKPVRSATPFTETPEAKLNDKGKIDIKHFWALVVLDIDEFDVKKKDDKLESFIKVLEVTQKSIQNAIMSFNNNSKWGDPTAYDLTITKTGQQILTRYTVVPSPHSDLDKEVEKAYKEMNIKLENLFDDESPFEGPAPAKTGKGNEVLPEEIPNF